MPSLIRTGLGLLVVSLALAATTTMAGTAIGMTAGVDRDHASADGPVDHRTADPDRRVEAPGGPAPCCPDGCADCARACCGGLVGQAIPAPSPPTSGLPGRPASASSPEVPAAPALVPWVPPPRVR